MEKYRILTINPGSTSTKIALFDNEKLIFKENLTHEAGTLAKFKTISEQLPYRTEMVLEALKNNNVKLETIDAFSGRGGGLVSLKGGTYNINKLLLEHARIGYTMQHASVLGPQIAYDLAQRNNKKCFVVNPVNVDEKEEITRITGIKGIYNESMFHALNQKETAYKYAKSINKKYEDLNLIVVHMGGGISIGAHKKGRVVDVNNASEGDGPFTPTRSGSIPAGSLVNLCYSGKYTKQEMKDLVSKKGGLVSLLGTSDAIEVKEMIRNGNKFAKLVYDSMIYQIAKAIGAYSVILKGDVQAIILTGGIANDKELVEAIKDYVSYIGKVVVMPGEEEMEALANGTLRVLTGEEKALEYTGKPVWQEKTE